MELNPTILRQARAGAAGVVEGFEQDQNAQAGAEVERLVPAASDGVEIVSDFDGFQVVANDQRVGLADQGGVARLGDFLHMVVSKSVAILQQREPRGMYFPPRSTDAASTGSLSAATGLSAWDHLQSSSPQFSLHEKSIFNI
jgi:hypothetical protein